jgi:hypothetical protein
MFLQDDWDLGPVKANSKIFFINAKKRTPGIKLPGVLFLFILTLSSLISAALTLDLIRS